MQDDLWGIDPEARYIWAPRVARTPIKDESGAVTDYGDPLPGAPVVVLKPIPERLAIKLNAAQSKYYRAVAMAADRVRKGADPDKASDDAAAQIDDAYPQELQDETLKASIAEYRIKSASGKPLEFRPDDWEWSFGVLRPSWRAELFRDIVNETAWSKEDAAGFLSQQESTTA